MSGRFASRFAKPSYLLLGGAELAAAERIEANLTGEDPTSEP